MFVSQAHSFQQQARLAVTLAWVGGYTNLVALLACGIVVSHVSGTSSGLGRDLAQASLPLAAFAATLLLSFFTGAAASGAMTELGRRRGWQSIYILPIAVETSLLAAFALLLEFAGAPAAPDAAPPTNSPAEFLMVALAAAAMGLQNATITRISAGVVRTTHVTGVLTDLGIETTQLLYWLYDTHRNVPPASPRALARSLYHHPTARRLALLAAIYVTFILGAALGTLAFTHFPRLAMLPPVAFLLWIVYQDATRPIAEIEPSDLFSTTSGHDLPGALAVFHLRKDRDRRGHVHRMPNLLHWADRLPPATKVVILDLADVTQLHPNAAHELRALLERFNAEHRTLILAGLDRAHFTTLQHTAAEDATDLPPLPPDHVCPDLELAIARGLALLAPTSSTRAT